MIETLNKADKAILRYLLGVRGADTFHVSNEIGATRTYAFQRLQVLNHRGLVVKSMKGRVAAWGVNRKLRPLIAKTLGLKWRELKKELKDQDRKAAEQEVKQFAWGAGL